MQPRSPDNHTDFAARAVEAEHKAAAATDVQKAERWQRIAARYRHVALVRLPQSQFAKECVGTDMVDDALYDPRSDYLIRRNHVLIAAAARAWSDIEENQLDAARARAQAGRQRAAVQVAGKTAPDRDLSIFNRASR